MTTTTALDKQKALVWLSKQLRWERTLMKLRDGSPARDRQAA